MSHNWNKSSNKCIDFIIFQEEIFCLLVFIWSDEDVFPVAFEKWLPEPSTEDKIIREGTDDGSNSSDKCREKWIDSTTRCMYSCGYHDELGWYWDNG